MVMTEEKAAEIIASAAACQAGEIVREGPKAGWFCAGLSEDPDSPRYQQPLLAAPKDDGAMTHYKASELVDEKTRDGDESRMPTPVELNQMFNVFAKKGIGGFRTWREAGDYWTSAVSGRNSMSQNFASGEQSQCSRLDKSNLRRVW
jgi:hypothetical protein